MVDILRPIRPAYPRDAAGLQQLTSMLSRMGLDFLLELPWNVEVHSVLDEQLFYTGNMRRENTIRPNLHTWTEEIVSKAYHTPIEGNILSFQDGRTTHREHVESKFKDGTYKRHKGWLIEDCSDPVLSPVFAFLIPILNLEKQTRVSLALATTIVVSMEQTEAINWSIIICKVIHRQIESFRARRRETKTYTYVCPYVAHIYWSENCLTPEERLQLLPVFAAAVHEVRGREGVNPSDAGSEPAEGSKSQNGPEPAEGSKCSATVIIDKLCEILNTKRHTLYSVIEKRLFDSSLKLPGALEEHSMDDQYDPGAVGPTEVPRVNAFLNSSSLVARTRAVAAISGKHKIVGFPATLATVVATVVEAATGAVGYESAEENAAGEADDGPETGAKQIGTSIANRFILIESDEDDADESNKDDSDESNEEEAGSGSGEEDDEDRPIISAELCQRQTINTGMGTEANHSGSTVVKRMYALLDDIEGKSRGSKSSSDQIISKRTRMNADPGDSQAASEREKKLMDIFCREGREKDKLIQQYLDQCMRANKRVAESESRLATTLSVLASRTEALCSVEEKVNEMSAADRSKFGLEGDAFLGFVDIGRAKAPRFRG